MSEIWKMVKIFALLLLFTVIAAYAVGAVFGEPGGNVAVVKIDGEISPEGGMFSSVASSEKIVYELDKADSNPNVKALLVEINSPGGTVVATREIAHALELVNKTKVCWMRDSAMSGAYWIATACDVIVADNFTLTGSIGVTGSYLEFSKLFDKYGISYVRLVGGSEKDIGTPYRKPTPEELANIQGIIDEMHAAFIGAVAKNRNLSVDYVEKLADGSIYTGARAKQLGLVDVLGGKAEAVSIIKQRANLSEANLVEYGEELNFGDLISGFLSKGFFSAAIYNGFQARAD